ncbi:MAG: SHOCT domain-containing protein [Actinomycetota bacterium]|nr:SHOCT domain-containing protein [Actinomycetota bacterium]
MSDNREPFRREIRLAEGERLLLAFRPSRAGSWPRYVVTLGLYALTRPHHVFALTDRRVICHRGPGFERDTSVPVEQVRRATVRTGLRGTFVELSMPLGVPGPHLIGPLPREQARTFADAVTSTAGFRAAARQPQRATEPTPTYGVAADIRSLVALHDQGVLTDGEFAARKARLLAGTASG